MVIYCKFKLCFLPCQVGGECDFAKAVALVIATYDFGKTRDIILFCCVKEAAIGV